MPAPRTVSIKPTWLSSASDYYKSLRFFSLNSFLPYAQNEIVGNQTNNETVMVADKFVKF